MNPSFENRGGGNGQPIPAIYSRIETAWQTTTPKPGNSSIRPAKRLAGIICDYLDELDGLQRALNRRREKATRRLSDRHQDTAAAG